MDIITFVYVLTSLLGAYLCFLIGLTVFLVRVKIETIRIMLLRCYPTKREIENAIALISH